MGFFTLKKEALRILAAVRNVRVYVLFLLQIALAALSTGVSIRASYAGERMVTMDSGLNLNIERGMEVWKKSRCAFCHGWAGDGNGDPRSPGVAANLRASTLDRPAMREIIRCGLPGGVMPYHDRNAYRDGRCYNVTANELGTDGIPNKGVSIREEDLDKLLAYIFSEIKNRGAVTLEECEHYFTTGSRNCLQYQ